jgi:signal transduction histidine kinase
MAPHPLRIVAIDDEPGDLRLLGRYFRDISAWDVELIPCTGFDEGLAAINGHYADLVVVDYLMGGRSGLDLIRLMRERGDQRPVIVLTGQGDEQIAAELMRAGASDYLVKGRLDADSLRRSIEQVLARRELERERALLEAELQQAQRMESIGRLAGGLAHDFNNMLTGIMGFVELAMIKSQGRESMRDLENVQQICHRMGELIQRLLSFSRRGRERPASVNLVQLLEEMELVLSHSMPPGIQLVKRAPPGHVVVMGVGVMLHQVLHNLCDNAVEAMPEGGTLTLRLTEVELADDDRLGGGAVPPGQYALIQVGDTGRGIAPEDIDRIFEPFFTTKALGSEKGTGLGLSVVWQNLEDHGGYIRVESAPGEGSTFSVFLPMGRTAAPDSGATEGPAAQMASNVSRRTALVVDDEDVVRKVATQMLERLDFKVYSASDGEQAVRVYAERAGEVDVVLLDVSMPGMDGRACFQKLREVDPRVRVVFSSGHDLKVWLEDDALEGASGFVQKPYSLGQLAQAVEQGLAPEA